MFPAIYVIWFGLIGGGEPDLRSQVMIALATSWALRLTYNFARKGGYNPKDEDYRWPVLREKIHPILFQIFNVFFIAIYQNILLLWIASPAYVVYQHRGIAPWNITDSIATVLFISFLLTETIADQQQWIFQTEKYRRINNKLPLSGDAKLGFLTHGLFRFSRHPNFFAEFSLWGSFYLFSVAATGSWFNLSLFGYIQLVMLFHNSTNFTESITLRKYPDYSLYQKSTSRLIPFLPGPEIIPKN